MRDLDDLMALVPIDEIKELKNQNKEYEDKLALYNRVMENVELFLSFWYKESSEFGKIKDNFNENDSIPCELRLVDNRVKLKIEADETDNSSD